MGFQQGLSGLNVSAKSLDAIGNNVANSGTVGFKSARGEFADVFAASLAGGGASQIGIGAALATVSQQFTQGNITATNNPLDVAINGGGFFRMSNNGALTYTRNGQFLIDKEGYVVNAAGYRLQGYEAPGGTIVQSTPTDIFIDPTDIQPNATTNIIVGMNLDSREDAIGSGVGYVFDMANPETYNKSTSATVYDTLGNPHVMTMYFVKVAPPGGTNPAPPGGATGQWDMYLSVDGTDRTNVTADTGAPGAPYSLYYDNGGKNLAPLTKPTISIDLDQVMTDLGKTNTAATPLDFTIDLKNTTQFGSPFGVNNMVQDGFTSGRLAGIAISADGIIRGRYSNGQSKDMGQIVLAKFNNPNGLQSLGGNQWQETSASGAAIIGAPGTGANGVVQSAAVEESNTDLTAELVQMITQQRAYQANAQTIKTQDSIMQTLVNLR